MSEAKPPPPYAIVLGTRGREILYTLSSDKKKSINEVSLSSDFSNYRGYWHTRRHESRKSKTIDVFNKKYPEAPETKLTHVPIDSATETFPPCITGRSHTKPFPTNGTGEYKAFDSLGTYTTGPVTPPCEPGNKYVQNVLDAKTGWASGTAMKKNSVSIDHSHNYKGNANQGRIDT